MRNHKKTIPAVAYPTIVVLIFIAAFVAAALPSALAQQSDEELAKQLANPIASLISVPFQSNFEFKLGPNNDGFRYTLNFQPVIPFSLNKDWNLIIRTIVPIIDQIDVIAPNTSENGLSGYDAKFLPFTEETRGRDDYRRRPGVSLPHGERLVAWNGEVWSRSNICGVETGRPMDNWLAFQSHLVSRGDEHRPYVSSTFLQPFISYITKTKTTFSVTTESTYDWHNDQWTVPVILTVAQLTKIGKLPVQFTIGGKLYAQGPSGAQEWGIRFVVTPLFPTGGKHPSPQQSSYMK